MESFLVSAPSSPGERDTRIRDDVATQGRPVSHRLRHVELHPAKYVGQVLQQKLSLPQRKKTTRSHLSDPLKVQERLDEEERRHRVKNERQFAIPWMHCWDG